MVSPMNSFLNLYFFIATAFKEAFYLNGTSMINVSSLDNSPFAAFGIQAKDLSTLVNSYSTTTQVLNSSNSTISSSNSSTLLGNTTMDPVDEMQIYNLVGNITAVNHLANCHNPFFGGYVALSPMNTITSRIANLFSTLFYQTMYFDNDEEMNIYLKSAAYNDQQVPRICFGVSFHPLPQNETGYSYSLRFTQANPRHEIYETDEPWRTHPFRKEWLAKYGSYSEYGFLVLQIFIDNIIIQEQLNNSNINITAYINSVITPTYYSDDLPTQLQGRSNIFIILSYILPFLKFIHYIMYEKEKRIKEGMKMMGINDELFYLSWLFTYFLIFLFLSIINSMFLKVFLYTFSDFLLVFIVQLLYTISIMFHGLLLTVFFSRSKTAVVAGVFSLFIEFLFVQLVQAETVAYASKVGGSISPVIAISLASDLFLEMEATQNGITLETVGILFNNYDVKIAIAFLILSSIVFFAFFLYFEQVFPNEFGKKKSPFFFLTCCLRKKRKVMQIQKKYSKIIELQTPDVVSPIKIEELEEEPETFEKVGNVLLQQKSEQKTVEIKNLTKVFPNGKKAVDKLSFTMYDNQIFVLLGYFPSYK